MKKFFILGKDAKIEIEVWERSYPDAIGTWEGDWVKATIIVEIPGYAADFQAELRTEEFQEFRNQLAAMNKALEGTAALVSIENAIEAEAEASMNSLGGIYWEVRTRYPISTGAVLSFEFASDQSYLSPLVKELDEVLAEFPVLERKSNLKSWLKKLF